MVIYPLTTWVGFLATCMLCTFIMVFLVSCGTYSWRMNAFVYDDNLQNLMWVQVFAFLWFTTFTTDVCTLVLCICYAEWYFFPYYPAGGSDAKKEDRNPTMVMAEPEKTNDKATAEYPSTSAYKVEFEDPTALETSDEGLTTNTSKIISMLWLAPNARDDRDDMGTLSPEFPGVCKSLCKVMKFYMGTIAFGSLIVAIVKFIQIWFEYIRRQSEAAGPENRLVKCLNCCIACAIACLKSCLEFITYGAYIQVAINGTDFCTSCLRFVSVVMANAGLLGAVAAIGGAVTFLGKVFVTLLTTMIMFIMLHDLEARGEISSYYCPLFFVFIGAWFTAGMFMNVYDTGIDTLLQCAVEDLDHQMKRPECMKVEGDDDDDMPRFMGPKLMEAFGESAKAKGGGCCSSAPEDKPKSETNKMNSKGEAEAEVSV
jgi:hypothetical protein